jgi:periplasmic protein TonB
MKSFRPIYSNIMGMTGFDDIIFKNRNKDYGAFDLRRKYSSVVMFSVIITLSLFIVIMLIIEIEMTRPGSKVIENGAMYNIGDAGLNKLPKKMANLPPAGGNIIVPNYIPKVVDSVPAYDTLINPSEGNGNDTAGRGNGNGNGNGDGPVFYSVEEPPSFPGGDFEREKFVHQNIIYPAEARINKVHGKVYIAFIVEKDGSISGVSLIHGIGHGCDEEALRVIRSMPSWKPGRQNGVAVRVYIRWPIVF